MVEACNDENDDLPITELFDPGSAPPPPEPLSGSPSPGRDCKAGWCEVCGLALAVASSDADTGPAPKRARRACHRPVCQSLAGQLADNTLGALRPFSTRIPSGAALPPDGGVGGGVRGTEGIPSVHKHEEPSAQPLEEASPVPVPAYERLRRNRCRNWQLVEAPEGLGLGRCECKTSCDPDTCLNAALGVECTDEQCAFGADSGGRCGNRRFAASEAGACDGHAEVFWAGPEKGFGLRAVSKLNAGQLVAEYVGDVVPQSDIRTWRYAMLLKTGVAIDASRSGGPARFMNHSCAPNCYAQRFMVAGEWRVGLFAFRDVAPPEELTFSYACGGRGGFGEDGAPEACACRAPGCSGRIGVQVPSRRRRRASRHRSRPAAAAAAAACIDTGSRRLRRGQGWALLRGRQEDSGHTGRASAAVVAWRRAARGDAAPWPRARWLCKHMFGASRRGGPCLELFFANPWPGAREHAEVKRLGLYLPRVLAAGRRAWLRQLEASPGAPLGLVQRLGKALLQGSDAMPHQEREPRDSAARGQRLDDIIDKLGHKPSSEAKADSQVD